MHQVVSLGYARSNRVVLDNIRYFLKYKVFLYLLFLFLLSLYLFSFFHLDFMNLSLILFTIGILGFVLNRKNILLMIFSLEILLLSITILVLVSSMNFDDILGQTYAIYIIVLAAAESAIGLGILVAYYRLRGSISLSNEKNVNTTISL